MTASKKGSWLERARRAVSSIEPLLQQDADSLHLRDAKVAYERAEHEFEQAVYLRASTRPGAGAEADKAHRDGKKAFSAGDKAWEAYKAATAR